MGIMGKRRMSGFSLDVSMFNPLGLNRLETIEQKRAASVARNAA
jgi:hypothetical protein